jgi:hypothetical protein
MSGIMRLAAFAVAAITIGGLPVGVASAQPSAGSGTHRLVLHGTGGLRPAIHLPRKGRRQRHRYLARCALRGLRPHFARSLGVLGHLVQRGLTSRRPATLRRAP